MGFKNTSYLCTDNSKLRRFLCQGGDWEVGRQPEAEVALELELFSQQITTHREQQRKWYRPVLIGLSHKQFMKMLR